MDYVGTAVVAVVFGGLSLLLNYIISVRSGAWNMSDRLTEMEKRLLQQIAEHTKDGDEKLDRTQNYMGDSLQAIRNKIHEVETWARDEFVRRASFEGAILRIEKLFERSDKKLDNLQETQANLSATVAAALQRNDR